MRLNHTDWAKATAAKEADVFADRIRRCDEKARLRAAVAYEATRLHGTRQDRVATINKRIREVTG